MKKAVLLGEYNERNMTKRMFPQLLEKNCGRARGGNLNVVQIPHHAMDT